MKRINLISGPRNVSTALMYSFAQRSDTTVVDEPLYASYLKKSKADHPGKKEVLNAQSTDPQEVIKEIILGSCNTPVLFIKNMAHHLAEVDWSFIKATDNIFLIRDPEEMLTSFIKTIPEPTLGDTAYKQQYEFFEYLREFGGKPPVVLDSKELLLDPPKVLNELCNRLGIPFQKAMLQWEPGPIPEDGVWAKHWYENVHKSTGFKPYEPKDEKVPERFEDLLEQCLFYYNELYEHSIKA